MKKLLICLGCIGVFTQFAADSKGTTTENSFAHEQNTSNYQASTLTFQTKDLTPWEAMESPVTALVMSMYERDLQYQVEEPYFVWSALYYMVGIYESRDWRVEEQGDWIVVPEEMIQDSAFALFGYSLDLPEIPEELADFIQKKEDFTYHLAQGDPSLTACKLITTTEQADGSLLLTGETVFLVDGSILYEFSVILKENQGMYPYFVSDVTIN